MAVEARFRAPAKMVVEGLYQPVTVTSQTRAQNRRRRREPDRSSGGAA